jgi:hypothetical protein
MLLTLTSSHSSCADLESYEIYIFFLRSMVRKPSRLNPQSLRMSLRLGHKLSKKGTSLNDVYSKV